MEHHSILISSELRSVNLKVDGAAESKNLDI